jgi:hypothetical protein
MVNSKHIWFLVVSPSKPKDHEQEQDHPHKNKDHTKNNHGIMFTNFKKRMLVIDHEDELVHLKLEANGVDDLHEDSLAQVCFELPFVLPYKPKDQ